MAQTFFFFAKLYKLYRSLYVTLAVDLKLTELHHFHIWLKKKAKSFSFLVTCNAHKTANSSLSKYQLFPCQWSVANSGEINVFCHNCFFSLNVFGWISYANFFSRVTESISMPLSLRIAAMSAVRCIPNGQQLLKCACF